MKKEEKASISIMKIICVAVILLLLSGIGVMAVNNDLKDVKIVLQNGYEMSALTGKATVSEVLAENNIVLDENQKTIRIGKRNNKGNNAHFKLSFRVLFTLVNTLLSQFVLFFKRKLSATHYHKNFIRNTFNTSIERRSNSERKIKNSLRKRVVGNS